MPNQFNLVDDPWLECISPEGSVKKIGILDYLENSRNYDITDIATDRAATVRFIVTLLLRAHNSNPELKSILEDAPSLLTPEVEQYLQTWHSRFNLFGPDAFMQVNNEGKDTNLKDIANLCHTFESGPRPELVTHRLQFSCGLPVDEVARSMIRIMCILPEGGRGLSPTACAFGRGIQLLIGDSAHDMICKNIQKIYTCPADLPVWENSAEYLSISNPNIPLRSAIEIDGSEINPYFYEYMTYTIRVLKLIPSDDNFVYKLRYDPVKRNRVEYSAIDTFLYSKKSSETRPSEIINIDTHQSLLKSISIRRDEQSVPYKRNPPVIPEREEVDYTKLVAEVMDEQSISNSEYIMFNEYQLFKFIQSTYGAVRGVCKQVGCRLCTKPEYRRLVDYYFNAQPSKNGKFDNIALLEEDL